MSNKVDENQNPSGATGSKGKNLQSILERLRKKINNSGEAQDLKKSLNKNDANHDGKITSKDGADNVKRSENSIKKVVGEEVLQDLKQQLGDLGTGKVLIELANEIINND